jgi:hypothetical protein
VFENRVLRKIFGPKTDEVTRGQRKLYDEPRNYCPSPNIIRMIKRREMGRVGQVKILRDEKCCQKT